MRRYLLTVLTLALLVGCAPSAPSAPAKPAATTGPAPTVPPIAAPAGPQAAAAVASPTAAAAAKPAANVPTGTVTIVQQLPITTLDATMEQAMSNFNPSVHMFDPLVFREPNGTVKPFLATAWSFPDEKTLRFKVRKGVKFHNGDPLTTADVAWTYNHLIDPATKSMHLPFIKTISEVKAVDDETVDFLLKAPDATLLGRLSILPVLPQKYFESVGGDVFGQKPIGSGPWKFVEWVKGQRVVMEANPDYWRGPPRIKTVIFRQISEDNTRITELLTGNADIVNNVPPSLAEKIKGGATFDLQTVRSLRNVFLKFNTKKAPFSDLRVREAIAHAIDVKLIAQTVLGGNAVPTPGGVMGLGVWGYYKGVDKGYDFDQAKAKQLLAAAGVAPGTKMTILSAQGRLLNDAEVVQAISGMLQQVGLNVGVQLLEFTAVNEDWNRKYREELDMHFWSNANNTADADYNYNLNFHSGGVGYYWSTPEVDALITKARTTNDPDARMKLYQDIGEKVLQAIPVVPLYDQVDGYGVSKRLKGFTARSDEMMYMYDCYVE